MRHTEPELHVEHREAQDLINQSDAPDHTNIGLSLSAFAAQLPAAYRQFGGKAPHSAQEIAAAARERSNLEPKPAHRVGRWRWANKDSKIEDFGAQDQTNLELSELSNIFSELESWEASLRSDPKVVRALRALDTGVVGKADGAPERSTKRGNSRRLEP